MTKIISHVNSRIEEKYYTLTYDASELIRYWKTKLIKNEHRTKANEAQKNETQLCDKNIICLKMLHRLVTIVIRTC